MKNIQNMFGLIDDEFLEEADPFRAGAKTRKPKNGLFLKITSLVACILLVLNIAVLIPIGFMLKKPGSNGQNNPGGVQNTTTDTNKNPDNIVIEYIQNVTNLQFDKPNGENIIIKLSSPVIGASSEYNDIINALYEIASGKIGSLENGKPEKTESNKDLEEGIWEELQKNNPYVSQENESEIEGDLIKRSDKYIYYLSDTSLKIYSIENEDSKLVSLRGLDEYLKAIDKALEIPEQRAKRVASENIEAIKNSYSCKELFLSSDLKTATIVVEYSKILPSYIYGEDVSLSDDDTMEYTVLLSLNIEDPDYVYVSDITTLFGEYREARLVNGEYLVFTEFAPRLKEISIPQYNDGDGFVLFPKDKIYAPNNFTTEKYILSFRIDEETNKVNDAHAYASFDGEIYISGDNIYITRQYLKQTYYYKDADPTENGQGGWEAHDAKLYRINEGVTEIVRASYKDGKIKNEGEITIKGFLNDSSSLSEIDGKLYVVTTEITYHYYREGKNGTNISTAVVPTNASLFCIDANEMAMISSVERFAKNGEMVQAVRFDGKHAYICTSKEKTDPVFDFDLTYSANITYKNKDTVPGLLVTLIDFGNGKLLGIGQDIDGKTKVELYEKTANNVNVVSTYTVSGIHSNDYDSYYIDRENMLFGFGILDYTKGEIVSKYVILRIKNGYISEVINTSLRGDNTTKRAILVDGCFYLISESDFTAIKSK